MADSTTFVQWAGESHLTDSFQSLFLGKELSDFYFELQYRIRKNYEKMDPLLESKLEVLKDLLRSFQYFLFSAIQFGSDVLDTYEYSDYTFGNNRPYHEYRFLHIQRNVEYRFTPSEIYFGFQSLIMEASSLLDKLTGAIIEFDSNYILYRNFSKERKYIENRFNSLKNGNNNDKVAQECNKVLKNYFQQIEVAVHFSNYEKRLKENSTNLSASLLDIFNECKIHFDKIIINLGSSKVNLRNELTHNKNILGFNKDLFCVFITDNGKLYIDHIINDFPIIATAHNLSRVISYFFIQNITTLFNSLRIDAEFSQVAKIPLNKYIMFWENYYVDYREYLNKGDSKIKLYTMKTVNKEHIDVCEECDEKILENCIK